MTSRAGKPDTSADIKLRTILDDDTSTGFVMVSGAGSGKTTSIIKALDHLRQTRGSYLRQRAKKIACITYTEVAVNEIWGDVGNDPLFHVSTIHSFLWAALKPFQEDIANWVDRRIDQKISDIEAKISGYTNRTRRRHDFRMPVISNATVNRSSISLVLAVLPMVLEATIPKGSWVTTT